MPKPIRYAVFNGNQFISVAHWKSDLLARMPFVDRIFLQEAVHFDCAAFVNDPAVIKLVGEWGFIQTREGDNDGRANTAILYRISAGAPSDKTLVDLGKADGPAPDQHTRERYLCAGLFPEGWQGSFHGFPDRDAAFNPELIRRVGEWAKANDANLLAADINQIPPAKLEAATGLKWHGVKIDGLFTNAKTSPPEAFPKGFSDHPGVRITVRRPALGAFAQAMALLRIFLKSPKAANAKRRSKIARKALHRTATQPPQTVPTPKPTLSTVARVCAALRSQIGYHEGKDAAGHWDNVEKYAALVPGMAWVSTRQLPWCDVFACWGLMVGGLKPGVDFPVSASCPESMAWYKQQGRWSEYPGLGSQVIFGNGEHTGVVVQYSATTITTVEGNTNDTGAPEGDGVYLKVHERLDPNVTGYGYPRYPEGIVSADPAWKGKK